MSVLLRVGVVQRDTAHRTQPGAVRPAKKLDREGQGERVVRPVAELELVALDIGAAKLLVARGRLVHLAGVDLHGDVRVPEAPHARARDMRGEAHPNDVSSRRAGEVDADRDRLARDGVALAAELELSRIGLDVEPAALAGAKRETRQIDAVISRAHPAIEVSGSASPRVPIMSAQFHMDPETYLDEIRAEVPRYDELQEATIDAIPFAPGRVLELGVGTGETTRRLLERHPDAEVTGLDSQPEMVFKARELGIEVRLARMQDPLPDGPWDLVISVLSVHHLDDGQKRDLFRRVREQSRAMVIGDLVVAKPQVTPLEEGLDLPSRAEDLVEWCSGEIVWRGDDLAVIRALYE